MSRRVTDAKALESKTGTTLAFVASIACALMFIAGAGEKKVEVVPAARAPAVEPSPTTAPDGASSPFAIDDKTGFVKAPGWELVAANCTACHSSKLVIQNRGDRQYWKDLIVWMQKTQNLWPFAPEVEETVLGYLSTHYGAKAGQRRASLPADLMPPGPDAASKNSRHDVNPRVLEAQAALAPLKQQLMAALKGGLEKGAPHAVTVCQQRAPEISHAISTSAARVGRTSHKTRNPKNKPSAWMKPLLDEYLAAPQSPGSFKTAELDDGTFGYVEPIYTGEVCLKCHGDDVPMETLSAITTMYPNDEATGFKLGELRGLFWVELAGGAR